MASLFLASAPSPLWYASRSAGTISLLLLTLVMVLGLATSARLDLASRWRFLVQGAHRNLSLLALVFLAVHITASVLDPYAGISWRDALIPFVASYRPFWLGLGVVSLELLLALIVSALLLRRIGRRVFRAIHWGAYACWPIALLHGVGTGSDVRTGWFYLVSVACVGVAVAAFVGWRLLRGEERYRRARLAAGFLTFFGVGLLAAWSFSGPLRPGWALAAGTPARLVRGSTWQPSSRAPAALLPASLDEALTGTVSPSGVGYELDLRGSGEDPGLRVQIGVPSRQSTTGTLLISRSGTALCTVPTALADPITGSCGSTSFQLQVRAREGGRVTARLTTGTGGGSSSAAI